MIVALAYRKQIPCIKFIGIHSEYDKVGTHGQRAIERRENLMEIHPLRTKKDYRLALSEVSALLDLDPSPRSAQAKRLEVLVTIVQAY